MKETGSIQAGSVQKSYQLPTEEPKDWGDVVVPGLTDGLTDQADQGVRFGLAEGPAPSPAALGGGWCRWLNLAAGELDLFRVIPEWGNTGFTPANGPVYNVDGFLFRFAPSYWYKIPDGALVWAYKDSAAALQLWVRTYIPGYYPEWRRVADDPPKIPYPW
jgi:hypothetical protein